MKRIQRIVTISLSTIALGLGAFAFLSNTSKHSQKVEASRADAFSGVYSKVTSVNGISANDKVILRSTSGEVLQDCGGNPAYLYSTHDNLHAISNDNVVYANNAYIVELTVRNGNVSGSFAFEGTYRLGWGESKTYTGYIAYDIRGSNNSNPGPTDYQEAGIGYFKDATGLRKSIINDSSWFLDSYTDGHMNMRNAGGHGNLGYTYGYAGRFVFGGPYGVNLYKKVEIGSISVATQPTKSAANGYHYKRGEKIDLSGLELDVTLTDGRHIETSYDENPNYFTYPEYAYGSGTVPIEVTYAGVKKTNINIIVDQSDLNYVKVTNDLHDYRGNYVIAFYEDDDPYEGYSYRALGFNMNTFNPQNPTAKVEDNIISIKNSLLIQTHFELVVIEGSYYLKKFDDDPDHDVRYLTSDVDLTTNRSEACALNVKWDSSNNCAYVQLKSNGAYLGTGGSPFAFGWGTKACLYKQELSKDDFSEINLFVNVFHEATQVCIQDGREVVLTTEAWSTLGEQFNTLHLNAQGFVAGATYTHNQETYGTLEDIIDRYDYIISKYSQFDDFMYRDSLGNHHNYYNSPIGGITPYVIEDTNHAIMVITIIAAASVVSLIALIIIKKKKMR